MWLGHGGDMSGRLRGAMWGCASTVLGSFSLEIENTHIKDLVLDQNY